MQFWGYVLQVWLGLVSKQDMFDGYVLILGSYDNLQGCQWCLFVDIINDLIILQCWLKGWISWQWLEDYYNEGLMVWMEVDVMFC